MTTNFVFRKIQFLLCWGTIRTPGWNVKKYNEGEWLRISERKGVWLVNPGNQNINTKIENKEIHKETPIETAE